MWELPPLTMASLNKRREENEELDIALSTCVNRDFYADIEYRHRKGLNLIASILGETGTGKSEAGKFVAKKISPKFNGSFVHFHKEDLMEHIRLQKVRKDFCELLDEQNKGSMLGMGGMRERFTLDDIESVCRKAMISFVYISPNLEMHNHHIVLETAGIDYEKKLTRLIILKPRQDYFLTALGYITTRLVDDPSFRDAYDKQKDTFIDDMLMGRGNRRMEAFFEKAEILAKDPQFLRASSHKKRLLVAMQKYPDFTKGELDLLSLQAEGLSEGTAYEPPEPVDAEAVAKMPKGKKFKALHKKK